MSDFYAELERQLVDAGRRRAVAGRVRRAAAGRGRMLLAVAGALTLLVSGGVLMPSLLRSGTDTSPGADPGHIAPAGSLTTPAPSMVIAGSVMVLNGTTTTGLARAAAERLERHGATIAAVESAPDQTIERTTVYYRDGAETQARSAAALLGARRVAKTTRQRLVQDGDADIVVVLGSDVRLP